jgi:alanyl-tRNA synthetase
MFKGGLAGTGEKETKYHTATHLLLASLRNVLKADIVQKGSNITAERMRFDFNWPEKISAEKLKEIEDLVNSKIAESIPVEMKEMPKEEAKKVVTTLSFDLSKYGDVVKVYKIGDFSAEFCGGPHVQNTKELGKFKILKEEAVAKGIRRIKAVLL